MSLKNLLPTDFLVKSMRSRIEEIKKKANIPAEKKEEKVVEKESKNDPVEIVDNKKEKLELKKWDIRSKNDWKEGGRTIGGKTYVFKSGWEANYARYLQMLKEKGAIKDWEYEPQIFFFANVKKGIKGYKPDFRVMQNADRYEFFEVKGYMDVKSRTKIKRFKKNYPQYTLTIIDKSWFEAFKEHANKIKGWEF